MAELTSCDPLENLHSDVFELIFQHLNTREVLTASLVSSAWFKVTNDSAKCREKLCLNLNLQSRTVVKAIADFKCLRKYQNIELSFIHLRVIPDVVKLLTGKRWKKVFIGSSFFNELHELYEIIQVIEEHVEELEIVGTSVRNEGDPINFAFPKLRMLRSKGLMLDEIANTCTSLKVLRLKKFRTNLRVKTLENIVKILTHNHQLEHLTMKLHDFPIVFETEAVKKYRFKLNSLDLLKSEIDDTVEDTNSLINFLETQVKSLKVLKLAIWIDIENVKLIFTMPKLHEVNLMIANFVENTQVRYNANPSIERLTISVSLMCDEANILNAMFDALPNLKFLKLHDLDNNRLNSIGPRCQNLEELDVFDFSSDLDIDPLFFPNVRRVTCLYIKPEARSRLNAKTREERSRFEQLLLDANQRTI